MGKKLFRNTPKLTVKKLCEFYFNITKAYLLSWKLVAMDRSSITAKTCPTQFQLTH